MRWIGWLLCLGLHGVAMGSDTGLQRERCKPVSDPGVCLFEQAPVTGPHYVEGRLRLVSGKGQGYILASYTDERNWLGFGLELDLESPRMNLLMSRMRDGKLDKIKSVGTDADPAGSEYTLRLDIDGGAITLFLNGARVIGSDEAGLQPGRLGFKTEGGQFAFDGLRTGSLSVLPTSLGLVHTYKKINLQAGEGPQRYAVRSLSRQQTDTVRFRAESLDPNVAGVAVDGDSIVVTPLAAGQTSIRVVSRDDDNLALNVATRVAPPFAAHGAAPAGKVAPAANDTLIDSLLQIEFDEAPVLANQGAVRIYRAADGALVDVIRAGGEVNVLGAATDGVRRVVRYKPFRMEGKRVTIQPHDGRLAYDTDYLVQVDRQLFAGARLEGKPFEGIASGWRFRTRAKAPSASELRVAASGAADFRTVQGALNHVMRQMPRAAAVTIRVANGRHEGLLYLRGKDNVTLRGESREGTIIAAENSDGVNPGAGSGQGVQAPNAIGGRSVWLVEDADNLRLDNLTLVNTTWRSRTIGAQAEAINFASDGRLIATHANFFSEQDTILVRGYTWFYQSLIAGNVDFMWGVNRAALFEESEIRSVGDSANPTRGGYVVQARTANASDPGFVFLKSRLTHGPGPAGNDVPLDSTFLGRPGPLTTWDRIAYIDCQMDRHIVAVGWNGQPRGGDGWYEIGSTDLTGKPLDLSRRRGGRVISDKEAETYRSRARVFAGFNNGKGWNPQP